MFLWSFGDVNLYRIAKKNVKKLKAVPSCFSSQIVIKRPFCDLCSPTFSLFGSLLLVMLLFKMAPSILLRCWSTVYCEKSMMCLAEKIHILDKLHSGMAYSAVGSEFIVNESGIY